MSLTLAENLLYTTVKLTSLSNGTPVSTGTGFFVSFAAGSKSIVAIITNKHVINGATDVSATCHIASGDSPSGSFAPCVIQNHPNFVVPHPSPDVDLCAINFSPILNQAEAAGTSIFFKHLDVSLIPSAEDWELFDAIEDVTMIGCPNGISDEANNLPIVRRGITASSLSKRYNGKSEFMVDMACFPGSSGSPIFLYDRNGYFDRKENSYLMGRGRVKLVGILYAGPLITNKGLVLAQPTSFSVSAMMHLGNAIRSTAILELEKEVKAKIPL